MYLQNQLTPENWIKQQREDYKQTHQNPATSYNHKIDMESLNKADVSISEWVSAAVAAIMEQKETAAKLTELTRVAGETIARAAASCIQAGNKSKRPVSGQGPAGGF